MDIQTIALILGLVLGTLLILSTIYVFVKRSAIAWSGIGLVALGTVFVSLSLASSISIQKDGIQIDFRKDLALSQAEVESKIEHLENQVALLDHRLSPLSQGVSQDLTQSIRIPAFDSLKHSERTKSHSSPDRLALSTKGTETPPAGRTAPPSFPRMIVPTIPLPPSEAQLTKKKVLILYKEAQKETALALTTLLKNNSFIAAHIETNFSEIGWSRFSRKDGDVAIAYREDAKGELERIQSLLSGAGITTIVSTTPKKLSAGDFQISLF